MVVIPEKLFTPYIRHFSRTNLDVMGARRAVLFAARDLIASVAGPWVKDKHELHGCGLGSTEDT